MDQLKENEYRCYNCKQVYERERTDEEAMKECKSNFGKNTKQEECALVCDDCYKMFMDRFNQYRSTVN